MAGLRPEPILVSVEDAASMLGVCRATFYKLLNGGQIRAVKLGRRTLVPVEDLKRFAAGLPEAKAPCTVR